MDDQPRTPWPALAGGRYLRSARPWRAAGYLAGSALTGIPVLLALVLLAGAGAALGLVLVGLPLLALLCLVGVPTGAVERRRLRLVDRTPARTPTARPPSPASSPGPGCATASRPPGASSPTRSCTGCCSGGST